jgi:hypothetical protein
VLFDRCIGFSQLTFDCPKVGIGNRLRFISVLGFNLQARALLPLSKPVLVALLVLLGLLRFLVPQLLRDQFLVSLPIS